MSEHRSPSAAAGLVAPAAIQIVDLADPLPDLELMPGNFGAPYRSVLAVARIDGELVGTAALPVDPRGHVSRQRLARGLRAQLEPELREAFSARGLASRAATPHTPRDPTPDGERDRRDVRPGGCGGALHPVGAGLRISAARSSSWWRTRPGRTPRGTCS